MVDNKMKARASLKLNRSRETLGMVGTPEAHVEEALPVLAIFEQEKPIRAERICALAV